MTQQGIARIGFEEAGPFADSVFRALGVPEEDAAICTDVLMAADRAGITSHGVNRLKPFYYDRIRKGQQSPSTDLQVLRETPTTSVLDCNKGMGMVAGVRSMRMAMAMARDYGMGMVAVRNSTHYGIAGYYAKMAAKEGFIGLSGTNARPSVAPTFGTEGVLGTNPLAVGVPTDEDFPFLLDCAMSLAQRGKVEYYARMGKRVPPGWVISQDGSALTEPDEILRALPEGKAAMVPLGGPGEEGAGYKGYGLATVIEILSSALQGGAFLKAVTGTNVGHFFIAIDVSAFADPYEFRRSSGEMMRELRASRKAPGMERIYTAGEKEYLMELESEERGILLDRSQRSEFVTMRDELGLAHRFSFEGL